MARRLPKGVRKKGDMYYGRWYAAGKRREKALSRDLRVAERMLRELERRAQLSSVGLGQDLKQETRLDVLVERYLAELSSSRRPSTFRSAELCLNTVLEELGPIQVKDLDAAKVRAMRQRLQDRGLSNRTCNMRVEVLCTMLRWAEQQQEIAKNPLPKIKKLPTTLEHRKKVRRSLTPGEARKLLDTVIAEDAKLLKRWPDRIPQAPLFLALIQTGLRSGEVRNLVWSDIDFNARTLTVRSSSSKNTKEELVDLSAELLEVLDTLRAVHARVLDKVPGTKDRVFLSPLGKDWCSETNVLRLLYRLLEKADIKRKDKATGRSLDVHALRVSAGSLLLQAGATLREAQVHLRHSSPTLTAKFYSDPRLVSPRRAVDSLSELIKNPPKEEDEKGGRSRKSGRKGEGA